MKSCEIIQDLMPLYSDKTISDDGRAMVKEHLAECDSCTAYLKMVREPASPTNRPYILSDNLYYRAIATRYRKKKAVMKALMVSAGVMCLGAVTYSLVKASPL
ncbi:MAG: zf-HC2 domain-containing protein [Oscillospiraceae bacterium]|nr:zf-HC2 domain-containing protein [Oscillospiraceae bacterium]